MSQQIINIGSAPNDGTGDQLRVSFDKCNGNFTELYKGAGSEGGLWNYNKTDTDTSTSPVSGRFRTNSGDYLNATQIAIHGVSIQGIDRSNMLRTVLKNDLIKLQDSLDGNAWCRYMLRGPPVDHGTWFQLDIDLESSGSVASGDNQEINFVFTANSAAAGGGGNVSNSGTPTNGQIAQWTDATHIQGINASSLNFAPLASPIFTGDPQAPTPATADNDTSIATTAFVKAQGYVIGGPYQPLNADLTAIAALTGTNTIYYRSGTNVWSPVIVSTGLNFAGGALTATAGGGGNVSNSGTPTAGQYAQWTDATHVQGVAASWLPLVGGTLTGAVYIDYTNPGLTFSKGSGEAAFLQSTNRSNNQPRWQMFLGDTLAESGSNAGSDFILQSFSDGGAAINVPFKIRRWDGAFSIGGPTNTLFASNSVGTIRCGSSPHVGISYMAATASVGGGSYAEIFYNTANAQVGSVLISDASTAYTTTSDARLKQNDIPFLRGRETIDKIAIKDFEWIATGARDVGVIAQEVETAYPQAISRGLGEDSPWGVDYSKYVPLLIQALQHAFKEIDELKTKLGAK